MTIFSPPSQKGVEGFNFSSLIVALILVGRV